MASFFSAAVAGRGTLPDVTVLVGGLADSTAVFGGAVVSGAARFAAGFWDALNFLSQLTN